MATILFNKRNANRAANRQYLFYSGQMQDRILVNLGYPSLQKDKEPPLVEPLPDDDVVKERDPLSWKGLPILLEMYCQSVRHNFDNPDDSLTAVIPIFHFENAIETAMLGGKIRFMGTRLHTFGDPVEPLIKEYHSFDWRLPQEDNPWLQRYLDAYRFMVQHADNDFALAWQGGIDSLNLAVQFRGTIRAYLDMFEEPENLERLLDYALELNLYLYGRVEEIVGTHNLRLYGDHPLAKYRVDRQPNKSVDAYALCQPGTLRRWGMKQITRINQLIGGGILHIHENGRQIIEETTEIPGWSLVHFTDGPGWPRSFEIRWELRRRMKKFPMGIGCAQEEFLAAMENHDLPGNTLYSVRTASLEEARRIMDKVLAYQAPANGFPQ